MVTGDCIPSWQGLDCPLLLVIVVEKTAGTVFLLFLSLGLSELYAIDCTKARDELAFKC